MLLIPFLNPGGRSMKLAKNVVLVTGPLGKPVRGQGRAAALKQAQKLIKQKKAKFTEDGKLALTVGGKQRFVQFGPGQVETLDDMPKVEAFAAERGRAKPGGGAWLRPPELASKGKRTARAIERLRGPRKAKKREAAFAAAVEAGRQAKATAAERRRAAQRARDKKKPSAKKKQATVRKKRGYTRGRSYKQGTAYASRPETIKWTEAAAVSGAVYPAGHAQAGRPMSFQDALAYERPVVGYLTRDMIKGVSQRVASAAGDKAKLRAAKDWLDTKRFGGVQTKDGKFIPFKVGGKSNKTAVLKALEKGAKKIHGMEALRRRRGTAWKRVPKYYPRSGKTPGGQEYVKGRRKPDYRQSWSERPARWQTPGAGKHLRVEFRPGRGPQTRARLTYGIGPSRHEVEELELAGFGAPLGVSGGRVQLNKSTRRKTSRRRKGRRVSANKPRNARGRFVKTNGNKKEMAVWNNGRRRRKSRKGRKSRSHGKTHSGQLLAVLNNGRRRRKSRKNTGNGMSRRLGPPGRPSYGLSRAKKNRPKKSRVKKNPGVLEALQAPLAVGQRAAFLKRASHVVIGMGSTALIGSALVNYLPYSMRRNDAVGAAGRFAACFGGAVLSSAAAYMARNVQFVGQQGWQDVFLGGFVYCGANLLFELMGYGPALVLNLPMGGMRSSLPASTGQGDWMELSGMGQGTSVISPYDLVAGESEARLYNSLDGMGQGGRPVPIEDLRGYPGQYGGGMNDWVEFSSYPTAEAFAATEGGAVGGPGETF